MIADANYRTVAVVRAGNGLQADEHEFNVTPQGTAYILAYSPVQASLASAGGPASGTVVDGVIQEVDIHTGLVMWEWHSLGHVDVSESYSKLPGSPTGAYDYFHINSLITDQHGNLLISARNTWALYDINHHTGRVMWRLGGKHSTFALGPGVQFAYQHNAQWLRQRRPRPVRRRGRAAGQRRPRAARSSRSTPASQDRHARRPARAHDRPGHHDQPGQRAAAARRRLAGRLGRAAQLHRIRPPGQRRL